MHRFVAAAMVGLSTLVIAGCSANSGDSTCAQFNGMNNDDKRAEVAAVMKARNARNSSDTEVRARVDALVSACAPSSQQDKPVKDLVN